MDPSAIAVLCILVITVALFIADRVPLDATAMGSCVALMLVGVLSPAEGLAGFSNPIVVMIGALFVVGAALQSSGIAAWLGQQLAVAGGTEESRVVALLMVASAVLSSFMSSTGAVAVLLPAAVSLARRAKLAPGRLLMPLAFGSLLGGMLTLIGTPPNLVVSDELRRQTGAPFGFFSFTPAALLMVAGGIVFMVTIGRRLLPRTSGATAASDASNGHESLDDLVLAYDLTSRLRSVRIAIASPLVGQSLAEVDLRRRYRLNVIGIHRPSRRGGAAALRVLPNVELHEGDELLLLSEGDPGTAPQLRGVVEVPRRAGAVLPPDEAVAELIVRRRSSLVGRTLREVAFRTQHRGTALAIARRGQVLHEAVADVPLRAGDMLLVKGALKNMRLLGRAPREFIVVAESAQEGGLSVDPILAPRVVVVIGAMLVLLTGQWLPNVVVVLVAAGALLLLRCVNPVDAYRQVNWESVMVVAGMLPMSTALEKTGLLERGVQLLVDGLADAGPRTLMAVLFVVTSAASQVMSNTATVVLMAPVASKVAAALSISVEPLLMAVAIAGSTSFATPVASPVNTLVVGPGGYRFADFARVGVPLQGLVLVLALLVLPLIFPFAP